MRLPKTFLTHFMLDYKRSCLTLKLSTKTVILCFHEVQILKYQHPMLERSRKSTLNFILTKEAIDKFSMYLMGLTDHKSKTDIHVGAISRQITTQ